MCKVSWCNNKTEFYNKSQKYNYCDIHNQYKDWVRNAPSRPWLMYKLEKILEGNIACECCGVDKRKQFPNKPLKQLITLLDVDHINPKIKGTLEGEQPSNYQLVCKDCHIFKSHDEGDYISKKYKSKKNNNYEKR